MRKSKPSILLQIVTMLAVAITITTLSSSWLSFRDSKEQVAELFDAEMAQIARVVQGLIVNHLKHEPDSPDPQTIPYLDEVLNLTSFGDAEYTEYGHAYERKLALQVWNKQGQLIMDNGTLKTDYDGLKRGYGSVNQDGFQWRTFTIVADDLSIHVAQQEEVRNELTRYIAWHAILPHLIMGPILLIAMYLIVRANMRPLNRLAKHLSKRDTRNLNPISEPDSPQEIDSLTEEINKLFKRVSDSYERERQFTADAAHELRTPLAAANIHLENIKSISTNEQVKTFSTKAEASIKRLRHLVEQLLVLRRIDSRQDAERPIVSVASTLHHVIDELGNSDHSFINFENRLTEEEPALVQIDELELDILLRNLIGNAIKYRTRDTSIDVSLQPTALSIFNYCPPIDDDIDNLFQRFSRGHGELREGSGLGLAICKAICDRNQIGIRMHNTQKSEKTGVEVSITWPLIID